MSDDAELKRLRGIEADALALVTCRRLRNHDRSEQAEADMWRLVGRLDYAVRGDAFIADIAQRVGVIGKDGGK